MNLHAVTVLEKPTLPDMKNISFLSSETFLDADLLILDPASVSASWSQATVRPNTHRTLDLGQHARAVRLNLFKRRDEVERLLQSGKLIVSFLRPPEIVRIEMDEGRKYQEFSNYRWVPGSGSEDFAASVQSGTGSEIRITDRKHPFASFLSSFKSELYYEAHLSTSPTNKHVFATNKVGLAIAFSMKVGDGSIVFVPPPPYSDAAKIKGCILNCARPFFRGGELPPPPDWARNIPIPGESELNRNIEHIKTDIGELEVRLEREKESLDELSMFRTLLYGTGEALEESVIKAFRLIGFEADRVQNENLDHDLHFKSIEGFGIAEIEGKENDAIHLGKLDQLTRGIQEYYAIEGSFPAGLLIGNAYRLKSLENRGEAFTEKVKAAAERFKFGLLSTVELFEAVVFILNNPEDGNFKARLRNALLNGYGKEFRIAAIIKDGED